MNITQIKEGSPPVLIASASANEAHRLRHDLEQHGFRVSSAADGPTALAMARRQRPGLVIADVILPGMNGYELCATFKADPALRDIPVILLTSLSDPLDFIRGLECRADDFVFKPCDTGLLLRHVQLALTSRNAPHDTAHGADIEFAFGDRTHVVTTDRIQLFRLLLSTYETALLRDREVSATRHALHEAEATLRRTAVLPAARTDHAQTAETGRRLAPFAARVLRVLLIDDDPSLIESLRTSLQDEGHKVTAADGGQAGIDAFRDAQRAGKLFDIVITDLGMPYVDGRQVIAAVRAMSPDTPIVVLTGWGQHAADAAGPPLQADRLLGKPPRIRELRAALTDLTGRRVTDRTG